MGRGARRGSALVALVASLVVGGVACQEEAAFTEIAPVLEFTPLSVDFFEVPQAATRRVALTIANAGNGPMTIRSVEVPAPFGVDDLPSTLGPGAAATADVWFRPDEVGPVTAVLRIDSDGGPAEIPLSGVGVPAVLTVRPTRIDWPDVRASTSDEVAVTVFAAGAEPVEAQVVAEAFARPAHFETSLLPTFTQPAPLVIPPGDRHLADVRYRPLTAGRDDGRLVFEVCGARCGVELEIQANAIEPVLRMDPPALAFGEVGLGFAEALTADVVNDGDAEQTVSTLTVEGDARFSARLIGGVPQTLSPGARASLEVTFAPTGAGPGQADAVLGVGAADSASVRLAATGTGVGPRFEVSPNPLSFGVERGPGTYRRPVLLVNAGSGEIVVRGLTLTGDAVFELDAAPGLPLRLGPGESGRVDVVFRPTEVGEYGASLAVDGDEPVTVPVTAGMAESVCRLEPNADLLRFGVVVPGRTRQRRLQLENVGLDPCEVLQGGFRAPDDGAFTATVAWPRTLMPGDVAQVNFRYAPTAPVVSKGTYVMTTADEVFPERTVSLQGLATNVGQCLQVVPDLVDFGVLRVGDDQRRLVRVRNVGNQSCALQGARLEASSDPSFSLGNVPVQTLAPGEETQFTVDYAPSTFGTAEGLLFVETNDPATPRFEVALRGTSNVPNLCVQPRTIDFGVQAMPAERRFELQGCGTRPVTVTSLRWTQADPELSLVQPPALPLTLRPGDVVPVTVRYATADDFVDRGVITVGSDDPIEPSIDVEVTGGPEIAPVAAGRFLYYWQIGRGDLLRLPLQGQAVPEQIWGPSNGKECVGCHSLSPDGRYLAFTGGNSLVVVDLTTRQEVPVGSTGIGHYPSWEPPAQPGGLPSYRFVYSSGEDLRIGSVTQGDLGPIPGASTPNVIETMPTWSSDGRIAYVRALGNNGGSLGFFGGSDLMMTTPVGGPPQRIAGASQNNSANYYPAFSPNARWIAYTRSDRASGTVSAVDARVELVAADGSGVVLPLTTANGVGGANSYPTWSLDGTFLSFSSNRTGGAGRWDLYIVPIDQVTGRDQPAQNVTEVNTREFEHAGFWSR